MMVLVVGSNGQLGRELQKSPPHGLSVAYLDVPDIDIVDENSIETALSADDYQWVINAAAYTAVDQAESEPETAYAVNRDGAANLARACRARGSRLIHISTDFIFDGQKSRPYLPDDAPGPLSIYGASKLAGELAVREIMGDAVCVIRTAWLYSAHGANFVKTILRLLGEKDKLSVVADQIGTPTWAGTLARNVWTGLETGLTGVHHLTNAGAASWYDLAVAVMEEALVLGLIDRAIPIHPIPTEAYPLPAKRPAYSVLDKTGSWSALGVTPIHWRVGLRKMLEEMYGA